MSEAREPTQTDSSSSEFNSSTKTSREYVSPRSVVSPTVVVNPTANSECHTYFADPIIVEGEETEPVERSSVKSESEGYHALLDSIIGQRSSTCVSPPPKGEKEEGVGRRELGGAVWGRVCDQLAELESSGSRGGLRVVCIGWSFEGTPVDEEDAQEREKRLALELSLPGERVIQAPDWSPLKGRRHGYGLLVTPRSDGELLELFSTLGFGLSWVKEVTGSKETWSRSNSELGENLARICSYLFQFVERKEGGLCALQLVRATGAMSEVWSQALSDVAPGRVCAGCGASILFRRLGAKTCGSRCRKGKQRSQEPRSAIIESEKGRSEGDKSSEAIVDSETKRNDEQKESKEDSETKRAKPPPESKTDLSLLLSSLILSYLLWIWTQQLTPPSQRARAQALRSFACCARCLRLCASGEEKARKVLVLGLQKALGVRRGEKRSKASRPKAVFPRPARQAVIEFSPPARAAQIDSS